MLDEFLLDSVLYARQRWILHDNFFYEVWCIFGTKINLLF